MESPPAVCLTGLELDWWSIRRNGRRVTLRVESVEIQKVEVGPSLSSGAYSEGCER